jgi:circadian clock protein KaiB
MKSKSPSLSASPRPRVSASSPPPAPSPSDTAAFEAALEAGKTKTYLLRLYVTGMTPRSTAAIENIKRICEQHLKGRYQLEVIDVFTRQVLAKGEQIIAAPTLIKALPLPLRRFIGDMSNTDKILLGLDLRPKQDTETR